MSSDGTLNSISMSREDVVPLRDFGGRHYQISGSPFCVRAANQHQGMAVTEHEGWYPVCISALQDHGEIVRDPTQ